MTDTYSRRDFLRATGGAAVAAGVGTGALSVRTEAAPRRARVSPGKKAAVEDVPPNEKIVVGVIGLARGYGYHMRVFSQFPDVEIGAVCDVYPPRVERAVAFTQGKAKGYQDFRRLLEQKDVDAVIVATPPHWHALISVLACQAGKDVLCEKPLSLYPCEALAMAKAARENKRVTHDGTQIHATENYRRCVDIVRSGALGKITAVTNFCTMNDDSEGLGNPPDSEPPEGLDWDMWLGPAPKVPFNVGRFRDGMHRYFKDYVHSWLNELGPHIVDLPCWALELGPPAAVSASGGRFATTSMADVPDTLHVLWEYPGMTMTWTMMQHNAFHFGVGDPGPGRHNGIVFHGKDATLAIVNYGTPQVLDKNGKPVEGAAYPASAPPSPGHEREFVDCIKSRRQPSCSFENHLPLHLALNLAHVSLATGRKVQWDADRGEVIGDKEASALVYPAYRAPWKLPV